MLILILASVTGAPTSRGLTLGIQVDDLPAPSGIEVRTYPEMDFVYIEHRGPYWTLGRAIDKAAAYIRAQGLSVPVVVRYAEKPNRRSTRMLRCRVGFIAETPHTPTAPFMLARLPEERTATFVIPSRIPNPDDDYETLRRWIDDHGHDAAGPVTEVYPTIGGHRGASNATAEVRFTLRSEDAPASDSAATVMRPPGATTEVAAVAETPLPRKHGAIDASTGAPPGQATDDSENAAVERTEPNNAHIPAASLDHPQQDRLKNSSASPPHAAAAVASDVMNGEAASARDDTALRRRADEQAGTNRTGAPAAPLAAIDAAASTAARSNSGTEKDVPSMGNEPTQPSLSAPSVQQLFAAGRYAEAVDVILPDGPPPAPSTQRWLLECSARISAICRGITRLDSASPEIRRSLTEFLRTFDDHIHDVVARYAAEPGQRAKPVDASRGALRETLTRDLDVAMVRIAMRSIEAPAAIDSLTELLQRVVDLRPITKNPPTPAPAP